MNKLVGTKKTHKKNPQPKAEDFLYVPRPGLEPGITAPKTGVLPLHHRGIASALEPESERKDKKDLSKLKQSSSFNYLRAHVSFEEFDRR